jgi:hypothetical protein
MNLTKGTRSSRRQAKLIHRPSTFFYFSLDLQQRQHTGHYSAKRRASADVVAMRKRAWSPSTAQARGWQNNADSRGSPPSEMTIWATHPLQAPITTQPYNQYQLFLRTSFSACLRVESPTLIYPKKARIWGAADFNDAMGIPYFHTDLFNFYGVSKQQEWAILKDGLQETVPEGLTEFSFDRSHHNNPAVLEKRGRKPILTTIPNPTS